MRAVVVELVTEIDVGDAVGVGRAEGRSGQSVPGQVDPSAGRGLGAGEHGLDRDALGPRLAGDEAIHQLGEVPGQEQEPPEAVGDVDVDHVPDDRPPADLDQRLGDRGGTLPQASPAAAAQDQDPFAAGDRHRREEYRRCPSVPASLAHLARASHRTRLSAGDRGGRVSRRGPLTVSSEAGDAARFELRPSGPGRVLDVGCGSNKHPGATGIDLSPDTEADVVHDLDVLPWPFESESFDQFLLQDVAEHLHDLYGVFAELHRLARSGARVHVRTPHFSSVLAYSDPTHVRFLSTAAIRGLAEPGFAHYSTARFRVVHVTLDLWLPFRALGIAALANRWPDVYEKYFAFRWPAMNIRAELEVLK